METRLEWTGNFHSLGHNSSRVVSRLCQETANEVPLAPWPARSAARTGIRLSHRRARADRPTGDGPPFTV
jgi:hypothetical protein